MSDEQATGGQPADPAPLEYAAPRPYPPQPGCAQQPYAAQPGHAAQPAYAPPQAYAQQQQYPPPGVPAPAPRKRRGLLVTLIVFALLMVCGAATVAAILAAGVLNGSRGRDAASLAERHFEAARSAVETASAAMNDSGARNGDTRRIGAAADAALKSLRTARDEIAAARSAIEPASASAGRTDYLAALAAATECVDGLEDLVAYVRVAGTMASRVREAGRAGSMANDDLNAAISAGNAGRYGEMKTKALAASGGYVRAAAIFREADRLDPRTGLDKAAVFADRRKQQADVVARMADEGRDGRAAAYDRDVRQQKKLGQQVEALGEPPIIKDPHWLDKRLGEIRKRVTAAGDKADTLREKALKELGLAR